jgi:tetratricopeptide (TPR) repeat protein
MNAHHFNLTTAIRVLMISHLLSFPLAVTAANLPGIGQIELCTGEAQISQSSQGALINAGDEIATSDKPNSRCRVSLGGGTVIHIGPATTVMFKDNHELTLKQGQLVTYVMPAMGQSEIPLVLNLGNGNLRLGMGKLFASAGPNKNQIAVFNDLVSATWHDNEGDKVLYPGNLVNFSGGSVDITQTPRGMETEMSDRASPESPAVEQATQAFKRRDLVTAKRLFAQIQQAYPYNAAAAYHLGLFELNDNKIAQAVEQWRKYVEIDPQGAKAKGVTKQLTLMQSQSIQDDVKQAIANENKLSTLPPEPNSIAVNPLINKGPELHDPIGKGLTAFIITDLMKVPGLKVLEREKLQSLIDEIKLSESGDLVEKSSRIRAGRIMRAEKLMIGDYLIETNKE